jgi:hypothetical protein
MEARTLIDPENATNSASYTSDNAAYDGSNGTGSRTAFSRTAFGATDKTLCLSRDRECQKSRQDGNAHTCVHMKSLQMIEAACQRPLKPMVPNAVS